MDAIAADRDRAIAEAFRLARMREEAEKQYAVFVASLNRITDKDIEENERRRKP